MTNKKQPVLYELINSGKSVNLELIRRVKSAETDYDIAMLLLNADYAEIFAKVFTPTEIEFAWLNWARSDLLLLCSEGNSGLYSDEKHEELERKIQKHVEMKARIRNILVKRYRTANLAPWEIKEFKKVIQLFQS